MTQSVLFLQIGGSQASLDRSGSQQQGQLRNREKSFVVYGFGTANGGTVERPGRSQKDAQQVKKM